jgi:hypothetical protein
MHKPGCAAKTDGWYCDCGEGRRVKCQERKSVKLKSAESRLRSKGWVKKSAAPGVRIS